MMDWIDTIKLGIRVWLKGKKMQIIIGSVVNRSHLQLHAVLMTKNTICRTLANKYCIRPI